MALGYVPTYERIAAEVGTAGRVCEIGVHTGGSLAMWQSLFPDGLVVGVDHSEDAQWPAGALRVVADQTDPGLPHRLRSLSCDFDLIVDDASHDGKASRRTFELLWPLVAPSRYYVLEDWMVGFPTWSGHGPRQPSMLVTARSFLSMLAEPSGEAESIMYRYGMAIIQRRQPPDG